MRIEDIGLLPALLHCIETIRDTGLMRCAVCRCVEGELLVSCPGYALNNDARDAAFDGNVADMYEAAQRRAVRREIG